MQTKNAPVEFKNLTSNGTFEGLLSPYGNVDLVGDMVEPGAYKNDIQSNGTIRPLLWQHDPREPIGQLTLEDRPSGLWCKGSLEMSLPTAQKAYTLIKARIIKGLSIGYETVKKEMDGAVRRLKEIKLYEGSIVTFGAEPLAMISAVKGRSDLISASLNAMTADVKMAKARLTETLIMNRIESMRRLVSSGARR